MSRRLEFTSGLRSMPIRERLEHQSIPEPNSGFLLWLGTELNSGYGQLHYGNKKHLAHRLSYQVFKGPIPSHLEIDHKCRVRICINPDHLRAVTHSENIQHSRQCVEKEMRRKLRNLTDRVCRNGHFVPAGRNHVMRDGVISCPTCRQENRIREHAKRREKRRLKRMEA